MGLEALCNCRFDDVTSEATVLLESSEMIIRSPFRRKIMVSDLRDVEVIGDNLRFAAGKSVGNLHLGKATALKWAKKIVTPPPGLAQKLGVGPLSPVFVIGDVKQSALLDILDGHTADAGSATHSLAVVNDARDLEAALIAHGALKAGCSIWIIHGKGPATTFGETPVREYMRSQDFRDTKVSAVSSTLSATRYSAVRRTKG